MIDSRRLGKLISCMALPLLLWLAVGCAGTEVGNPDINETDVELETARFSGDAELEAYLKTQYAQSIQPAQIIDWAVVVGPSGDQSATSDDEMDAAEHSETNVQEAEVDESDMVKTDGVYLYIGGHNRVRIVDTSGEMRLASTLPIDGQVDGLFVYDHLLVVLYTPADGVGEPWVDRPMPLNGAVFGMPYWMPVNIRQGIAFFDLATPDAPDLIKAMMFDGALMSSRLVDGRLHLIQRFLPSLPPIELTYDGTPDGMAKTIDANRAALAGTPLSDLIPGYRMAGESADKALPTVVASDYYYPVDKAGGGTITTVVSFNLNREDLSFTSVGMVADAHIVYASSEALYVAAQTYDDEGTDSESTAIYKYDLTGDTVRCVAGGIIPGWLLNQFSLGEYQGVLRVATTTGRVGGWAPEPVNRVLCLKPEDKTLAIIGRIEDIANGEQIYAARFIRDVGFLVTFVKIDPLFTLDLADPAQPKIVGELKVPGYSTYIHPLDEGHLITIGKATEFDGTGDWAWYQGVQLSIFDISDFARPTLAASELIGDRGTHSDALYEHKAFTFWPEHNLLAIPVQLFEHLSAPVDLWRYGTKTFEGLYVYRLAEDGTGFELLGRIDTHGQTGLAYDGQGPRGVFIGDQVYAVTGTGVKSAPIEDIDEEGQQLLY